jgi:uncharacterized membrane protein
MDAATRSEREYELTTQLLEELVRRRPASYRHDHPPVRDVNREMDERLTSGQRVADAVARGMGSWRFIIGQSAVIAVWVALNLVGFIERWDPYPFILLNLGMSLQAAYAAPVIMMSQNRQSAKDRLLAEHDYQCNLKAEEEVKAILKHLEYQDELILQVLHRMEGGGAAILPGAGSPSTGAEGGG